MSFSVNFLAFYLLPIFIVVSYSAPPEFVHPLPTRQAATTDVNAKNGNLQSSVADQPTVSPQKSPAPGENETTNETGIPLSNNRSFNHSVTNKSGSDQLTVATQTTTNRSMAAPEIIPTSNATAPSQSVKNVSTPVNVSASNGTTLPPHHKKAHTSTAPPHTVTHPHVAVPINMMPDSENILEDIAHHAPRPLRTAEKFNPTFGAIVAAICITTAVGGYVILMAWRKIEMDRYGNRQMLINEDDFGDIQDEDMRHFEASCIQIDA